MNKKIPLSTFIVGCLLFACGSAGRVTKTVMDISESVKSEFSPDKRISVWKIEVKRDRGDYIITGETDNIKAREAFIQRVKNEYPKKTFKFGIKLLPDDTVDKMNFGLLRTSTAKMRSGTSVLDDIVSETLMGLPVEILKEEDDCYFVRSDDGYLGWIDADHVIQGGDSLKLVWGSSDKVVFVDVEGMVFSLPSMESDPVSDCVMGNQFMLVGKSGAWTKVAYPDARTGYIPTKQLESADVYLYRTMESEKILKTAKSLLGRPYLWGAASTKEMDCSGFMQTVFRNNGYLLPRDTNMQVNEGREVDTSGFFANLRPCDLLFFGQSDDKISHVGMYIGDYEFIHCSGRVRIDSFYPNAKNYNNYWENGLRRAKRLID